MLEYLAFLSRWLLVMVLLAAVVGKLRHQNNFMSNLRESFEIPESFVMPAFVLLVLTEATLCIALIMDGGWLNITFTAVTIMFGVMTVTLSVMLLQHKVFKCACFGEPQQNASFADVLRNSILILAASCGISAGNGPDQIAEQLVLVMAAVPLAHLMINFTEFYPLLKWSEKS